MLVVLVLPRPLQFPVYKLELPLQENTHGAHERGPHLLAMYRSRGERGS